jgi:hypothetical protein
MRGQFDDIPQWFLAINADDIVSLQAAITDANLNEEYICPSNAAWSPLIKAIRDEHTEAIIWLIRRGADLSRALADGDTPLCAAFEEYGSTSTVFSFILDAGAKDVCIIKTYQRVSSPDSATHMIIKAPCTNHSKILIRRMIHSANGTAVLKGVPKLPPWVVRMLEARERCTQAATIVVGLRRFRRTNVVCMEMARLLARYVMQTRGDEDWEAE